jgi:hypothetical protein
MALSWCFSIHRRQTQPLTPPREPDNPRSLDGLELVVCHGHANQWVEVIFSKNEFFQVVKFFTHDHSAYGRGVGDGAGRWIADVNAVVGAKAYLLVAENAAKVFKEIYPEGVIAHGFETLAKSSPVTEDFFGGGVGNAAFVEGRLEGWKLRSIHLMANSCT